MSNLTARALTASILLPPLLAAIWLGGIWLLICVGLIGLVVIWEWLQILEDSAVSPLSAIYIMALLGVLLHFWQSDVLTPSVFGIVGIGALGALLVAALHKKHKLLSALGVVYLLTPFILLLDLRGATKEGMLALLVFLSLVWASDIGGYCFGRIFGGAKLAPKISGNKTWSGAIGSLLFSLGVGAGFIYGAGFAPKLFLWAILVSLATQAGDLIESYVKRYRAIKDSSNLLPGHGGFLDRLDGLLFAIMVLYFAFLFLGLGETPAAQLLIR